MSRTIHAIASDATHSVVVLSTASSGGGQWETPVKLSTLRLKNEDLADVLQAKRVLGNSRVEVLESWKVNAANQGPRSKFGKTLAAMRAELDSHLAGSKVAGQLEPMAIDGLPAYLASVRCACLTALPMVDELPPHVDATTLQDRLTKAEAENAQLRTEREQLKGALAGVLASGEPAPATPGSKAPRL